MPSGPFIDAVYVPWSYTISPEAADTTVFGVPAHSTRGGAPGQAQLDHNKLPDYCSEEMRRVQQQLDELRKEFAAK